MCHVHNYTANTELENEQEIIKAASSLSSLIEISTWVKCIYYVLLSDLSEIDYFISALFPELSILGVIQGRI